MCSEKISEGKSRSDDSKGAEEQLNTPVFNVTSVEDDWKKWSPSQQQEQQRGPLYDLSASPQVKMARKIRTKRKKIPCTITEVCLSDYCYKTYASF